MNNIMNRLVTAQTLAQHLATTQTMILQQSFSQISCTYAVLKGVITGLAVGARAVLPCPTALRRVTRIVPLSTAIASVIQRREGHGGGAQLACTVGVRNRGAKVSRSELVLPLAAAVAGLQSRHVSRN